MPAVRLTKRAIDAIPLTTSGQVLYRDTDLPGFGLRVGSRAKTFVAEGQVRRRTVRVTVGRHPVMAVEEARRRTLDALSAMARGVNPAEEARGRRAQAMTLEEAFAAFFEAKPALSPVSVDNYRRTPRLYLADWRKKPLREITREMILARHRRITERHGALSANAAMRHLRSVYNFTSSVNDDLRNPTVLILGRVADALGIRPVLLLDAYDGDRDSRVLGGPDHVDEK